MEQAKTNHDNQTGESMKDSMAESPPRNDNTLIQGADDLTDHTGKLNAEEFKAKLDQENRAEKENQI